MKSLLQAYSRVPTLSPSTTPSPQACHALSPDPVPHSLLTTPTNSPSTNSCPTPGTGTRRVPEPEREPEPAAAPAPARARASRRMSQFLGLSWKFFLFLVFHRLPCFHNMFRNVSLFFPNSTAFSLVAPVPFVCTVVWSLVGSQSWAGARRRKHKLEEGATECCVQLSLERLHPWPWPWP